MVKNLLKFAVVFLVFWGGYKVAEIYALMQFGKNFEECGLKDRVCPLIAQRADAAKIGAELNSTLMCVSERQNLLEAIVLPVRRQISSDTLEGRVPYTEADKLCSSTVGRKD